MRRDRIENNIYEFFPKTIANLISNYDCDLTGQYHIDYFGCTIKMILPLSNGYIVIACVDICKIFDPKTKSCINNLKEFYGSPVCLAQLDEDRIVVGCAIKIILITKLQIWNTKLGICENILQNDEINVTKITILSNREIMVVGYNLSRRSMMFRIWTINDGLITTENFSGNITESQTITSCISLHTNGDALVIINHCILAVWNPQLHHLRIITSGKDLFNPCAVLLSNGKVLTFHNREMIIWDNNEHIILTQEDDSHYIVELPDERLACSNDEISCELKIYDMRTKKFDLVYMLPPGHRNTIKICPNGNLIFIHECRSFITCV